MNRTNIQEANKHLQALYKRVDDLERVARDQHDMLMAKDTFIQTKINELTGRDLFIQELQQKLQEKDKELNDKITTIDKLENELTTKTTVHSKLNERNKTLDSLLQLLPELKDVVARMDSLNVQARTGGGSGNSSVDADGDGTVGRPVQSNDDQDTASAVNAIGDTYTNKSDLSVDQSQQTKLPKCSENGYAMTSVGDMARNFVKTGRSSKFSLSEADDSDLEENVHSPNFKEMYF